MPDATMTIRAVRRHRRRLAISIGWATYRRNRSAMIGLWLILAFGAVALVGWILVGPGAISPSNATGTPFTGPSGRFPLGTDNFGRSVLLLMIAGARISLLVGITAMIGAVMIGAIVGILAGYFAASPVDTFLSGVTNLFLSLPWVVLAIVLAALLGPTLVNVIVVIAVTSWPTTARIIRAQTLSVRERSYVDRARSLGAGHGHVILRHIAPNVAPLIFANATLTVALSILSETTLSVLGLGDPTAISWGRMIEQAFANGAVSAGYWWWLVPPGVAIVAVTLSFTMCGYGIEEITDPRLRKTDPATTDL
jgi:peptide/nickel transport system permease protein